MIPEMNRDTEQALGISVEGDLRFHKTWASSLSLKDSLAAYEYLQ